MKGHDVQVILSDGEINELDRFSLAGSIQLRGYYGCKIDRVPIKVSLLESTDQRYVHLSTNKNFRKDISSCHLQIHPKVLDDLKSKSVVTECPARSFYAIGIYRSCFLNNTH